MERVIHESKETLIALVVASCLVAGIGGAAFYTFGPEGWLTGMLRDLLRNPNLSTLASLAAVMTILAFCKRWLDRNMRSSLNNLLVGVVALGGFALILQGVRATLG